MARMLRPLAMSALLALLSCPGCAAWHYRHEAKQTSTANSSSPSDGGFFKGMAQDLSNASAYDWNFRRLDR